ncbi:hypothetical protein GCM10009853_072370 [Glycomyces scopariae]
MALDLYAGVPVSDFDTAVEWYARFFGAPASFLAGDTEAVWELAEHRAVAVELRPDRAGNALNTLFVDDFAMRLERIALAGIQPVVKETYPNGVRHATFRDPDGNEFSLGGAPE